MHRTAAKLIIVLIVTAFFSTSALVPAARAAAIDTSTYLNISTHPTKAELHSLLTRDDVREQLVSLGVDPSDAANRIASLTHEELAVLQQKIDELPAGANALAILGALLLVLIILEVLGVTNVFTRL